MKYSSKLTSISCTGEEFRSKSMEVNFNNGGEGLGRNVAEEWAKMREKMEDRVKVEGKGGIMGRIWDEFDCVR